MSSFKTKKGMTLVEVMVSVAILGIIIASIYGLFVAIINGIAFYREKSAISALADRYLEVVKNLPYSKVGTLEGNPNGPLPDLPNPATESVDGQVYDVYYAVSYVDDPADGTILLGSDPAPNDYKQVKLYVKNTVKNTTNSFLTNVAPQSLEGLSNAGAILISVFDAVGQPVSGATITIENYSLSPSINLTRTSDANGKWLEVGLPVSANNYHIEVNKFAFSSDQTYPATLENPTPAKEDSTVADGQVTQISFSIDKKSNLTINTTNQTCQAISSANMRIYGHKLIGLPSLKKFDNNYISNSQGQIILNDIEWDSYIPAALDANYMIYGSSPIQEVNVLPDTNQVFSIILGQKTENSLLFLAKDGSNNTPLEGVMAQLRLGSESYTGYTGGSIWSQQSWSGGSGQTDFLDGSRYFEDDGNIDNGGILPGFKLKQIGENYEASGTLTSSTYDTGTEQTSFTILTWQPESQNPSTSVKFQIAANNDNETWEFKGPDGTSSSYYDVPGTTINNLNGNRYIRYKALLTTSDTSQTPVVTSVNINFVSGCSSPGQFMFAGLQESENYSLDVSMEGYQSQTIDNINIEGNDLLEISLIPNP